MGMFDDIRCDHSLPEAPPSKKDFQTKDLERTMTSYKITTGGRLLRREYEWEENEKAPLGIWRVPKGWTDTNYHGTLNFYTYTGNHDDGTFEWWDYYAKFTDGQLVKITGGRR